MNLIYIVETKQHCYGHGNATKKHDLIALTCFVVYQRKLQPTYQIQNILI